MDELILDTNDSPEIYIESVGGDLRLNGWDQNQVQAETDDEDSLSLNNEGGQIKLIAEQDCTVNVPRKSNVQIVHVGGDAKIKSVEGALQVNFVGGDLMLRQVGTAQVTHTGGDLNVKRMTGALSFQAGGDASIRSVSGNIEGNAGADLYLREIGGSVQVNGGGDVVISTPFAPGSAYAIKAGADAMCRVVVGTSAKFAIKAGGEISVDVVGARIEGNSRNKTVTLAEGAIPVAITAGGDVLISNLNADPDTMGEFGESFGNDFGVMAEELTSQIEAQMSQMESQIDRMINERLGQMDLSGLGVNAEEIANRAKRAAERAAETARRKSANIRTRMESRIDDVEERAERASEKHERQGDRRRKTGSFFFKFDPHTPRPPVPPVPPRPPMPPTRGPVVPPSPVSDEERMAVLKMLEEGKITVQQAETLLAALEGSNK